MEDEKENMAEDTREDMNMDMKEDMLDVKVDMVEDMLDICCGAVAISINSAVATAPTTTIYNCCRCSSR